MRRKKQAPPSKSAATATATPFVASCSWGPTAAGNVVLGATFTPTDTTNYSTATAAAYTVAVAVPVQTITASPLPLYVDTIVASGNYATNIKPVYGGCQITNEFLVGQTIVFRAYGWDDLADRAAPEFIEQDADEGKTPKTRLDWPAEFKDEVLARLLALNAERAAAERAAGVTAEPDDDDSMDEEGEE